MMIKGEKSRICFWGMFLLTAVLALPMKAEAVSAKLNRTNITMAAGTSYDIILQGAPDDVMWRSNKKSVVRINYSARSDSESHIKKIEGNVPETVKNYDVKAKDGNMAIARITARKAGTAKITARTGNKKYTCKVKVVTVRLSDKKRTLKSGESFTIKGKGQKISKWKSSDTSVATVNAKGKVTAKKAGKVMITGILGVSQLKCTVVVKADKWEKLLGKYSGNDSVRQLVFVKYISGSKAKVMMYNKDGNGWKCILECQGYVGKKGIDKKKEGDKKTPTGVFDLTEAFGIKNNPGTSLPYIKVNKYLYWCGDKKYYNQLIDVRKTLHKCKGEHLIDYIPQYNYGMVLDYNSACTYGAGSAIFLHCKGTGSYTAGCIAVSQKNMIKILNNAEQGAKICIYKK